MQLDSADRLHSVKTKVQQRALAGERRRGVLETFHRLIRGNPRHLSSCSQPSTDLRLTCAVGPDPNAPKPILRGIARLYQGLGVSALRSVTTHGLLWTFFDLTASYIDQLPGRTDHES